MKVQQNLIKVVSIVGLIALLVTQTTTNAMGSASIAAASEGFSDGGTVMTPIGSGNDYAMALAIQTDGKFVVAGYIRNGTDDDIAVARYNSDGNLDTTFGNGGFVITRITNRNDRAEELVIQADGKILVAGATASRFGIVRYNSDGTLDPTWGSNGIVIENFGSCQAGAYSIVIQSDGKIVVAGVADFCVPSDFAVARYNSDGSLDTTFGGDGKVTTSVSGNYQAATGDILLQSDGKIIITGMIALDPPYSMNHHFGMVRYNSDGSLDTTFGSGGIVITYFGANYEQGDGAVLLENGKIVMVGEVSYFNGTWTSNIGVARYNNDGSLDATFGNGGKVNTDIGGAYDLPTGVAIQTDGQIVVAGFSANNFAVLRYNNDGGLDTTFGGSGYVRTDFCGGFDGAMDVVIQNDGRIVVTGWAHNGTNYDFGLARYNPDGSVGPLNLPPIADAGGSYSANEGAPITLDASASSDPDGDSLQYRWDFDNDGSWDTAWSDSPLASNTWNDDWIGNASVEVSDGEFTATAIATITVNNVAPVVGEITVAVVPLQVNTTFEASATFTDIGTFDTHTAIWGWGDGNTLSGAVDEANGSGTVAAAHVYTAPGIYTAKLTVIDDDGGVGESIYRHIVAYDPNAGFVTGGGWINSPAGACQLTPFCAGATGKVNFGFVTKYQNGANIPTGQTEFNFKAGKLNFHSTDYQWLVVAGAKAQYQGFGTINGTGNYGFMVTVLDGQINGRGGIDKFRMNIWDLNTGTIIYDNQSGAAEDADPIMAIDGGNIVVHSGGGAR